MNKLTEAQSSLFGFLASRILASKLVHYLVTRDIIYLVDQLNVSGVCISYSLFKEYWLRVWRRILDVSLNSRWYMEVTTPMQCESKPFFENSHLIEGPAGHYYNLMPVTGQDINFSAIWSGTGYNHTGPCWILGRISCWKGAEWVCCWCQLDAFCKPFSGINCIHKQLEGHPKRPVVIFRHV